MKQTIGLVLFTLMLGATSLSHPIGEEQSPRKKAFTVSKGGTLEVSISGGDIVITTWEKNEVAMAIDLSSDDEMNEVMMTREGNTVRISNHDGWGENGRLEISIPSQFNLSLVTAYGDLSVRGKLIGNINAETSAGNIRCGDVDGEIDAHTSGGDIQTGRIGGKALLNTSGGDIDVVSSTGELDIKSSGGEIRVGNVGKSLRAKTAGGDIMIGDVGGEAVVATAGGNVKVGKVTGRATLNTSGGDIELSGGNGVIKASTSGGNVMLTNIAGSVDAKTAGGDIRAELVPSGKGNSRLASASGIITLYIPESAKATISARIRIRGGWRSQSDDYFIRSDFKEESSSRNNDEQEIQAKYILNGGGETITLETVNSDIEIRKLKK